MSSVKQWDNFQVLTNKTFYFKILKKFLVKINDDNDASRDSEDALEELNECCGGK